MFKSEKGAEFVGIRNYTSSKSEVSNQTLNVGIDVLKAKEKDLETLKGLTIDSLYVIADDHKIDHKIADKALAELLLSGTKNVSKEIENRTIQSQSQTNAYTHVNKGMKILNESGYLYVSGFVVAKEIIKDGIYPTVNKQAKTIIKDAIKKELKFKMNKYRSFIFKEAESYRINKNEIHILR
jgi:predicted DNA binding protein